MRAQLGTSRRIGLVVAGFGAALTAGLALGSGTAMAAAGYQDIGDTGGGSHALTNVVIGTQLSCQDLHFGDSTNEWYPPAQFVNGNCGTFVSLTQGVDSTTTTHLGPPCVSACVTTTPWTAVSQSAVTHPAANTNQVVTVVTSPDGHLRMTQTDTYHVGDEFYSTSVLMEQIGGDFINGLTGTIYVAGDCYLQNSDRGYGYTTNGVFCRSADNVGLPNQAPGPRLEGFTPLTAGSHYFEAYFGDVWNAVASGNALPDTCVCTSYVDNGAGLSWPFAIRGVNSSPSAARPATAIPVGTATFTWNTIIQPLALATPTPTPTPTATAAPTGPSLPATGAGAPGAPRPAPSVPWLWVAIAAAVALAGFGLSRKLPRQDV